LTSGDGLKLYVQVNTHSSKYTNCSPLLLLQVFPAWFSKWILDYAELHSAIIVSPDYRLLPEATGADILDDMKAFWSWFHDGGPAQTLSRLGYSVPLDTSKVLLLGESAGGYLAVQSVLSGFVRPKAMLLLYPMLDMKADHYTREYAKPIVNVPNFPSSLVDEFLAKLPPVTSRRAITEADPPSRLDLALASVQTGRFLDFLSTEPRLFVLDRIASGDYAKTGPGEAAVLPPFLLLHGEDDSAVPVSGTRRFLETLEKADAKIQFRCIIRPGDHGFEYQATIQDDWLRDGLDWVSSEWLANKSRI
jgi:acetyl esterase/lipase